MRRIVNFAVLAMVLLLAQRQGYVHPISHVWATAAVAHERAVVMPGTTADCIECALLAAGSNAAFAASSVALVATGAGHQLTPSYPSRAADVPAWFNSRAPPILL